MQPIIFELVSSENALVEAAQYLAEYLVTTVSHHPTLLLLSGGSAISMYQQMFALFEKAGGHLDEVSVSLVDERLVSVGDTNSNGTQLEEAGVVSLIRDLGGTWIPYLTSNSETGEVVATRIANTFDELRADHQVIVLAGLGDDAHTSGLLPTQDPVTNKNVFESADSVVSYDLPADTDNPYRKRLTTTPHFLSQVAQIIVYAVGGKKRSALERLISGQEDVPQCPAICLRLSQKPVTVVTDIQV